MSHVSDQPATGVLDDVDVYTQIYRRMLLIRGFEDLVQSLFLAGEVYGTTHLYSGQEAVATGFASVLEERDRIAAPCVAPSSGATPQFLFIGSEGADREASCRHYDIRTPSTACFVVVALEPHCPGS